MSEVAEDAQITQDKPNYFSPNAGGVNYKSLLKKFADTLKPRTYLEIGTQMGASLELFNCECVSIDPFFQVKHDRHNIIGPKPSLMMFQLTSDEFFLRYDLKALLPSVGTIDFAFLDGLHQFEFLLRDFINTEKNSRNDSLVCMHDLLPVVPRAANRRSERGPVATDTKRNVSPTGGGWAGDVWKLIPILRKYRPELKLYCFNAPPTGLIMVTNLDPENTILTEKYDEIMQDWMQAERRPGWFDELYDAIELTPTQPLMRGTAMIEEFKPFQTEEA